MRPSPSFTQFVPLFAAALLAPTCLLTAQNRGPQHRERVDQASPDFHVSMGFSGGEWEHKTSGSGLDDDTDALLFRFQFEGNNSRGAGGGFRFEYTGSDDDLFQGTGFARSEARVFSGFLHFTYRVEARRFTMPLRAGLMTNYYTLEEVATDDRSSIVDRSVLRVRTRVRPRGAASSAVVALRRVRRRLRIHGNQGRRRQQ
jgi:hypothetical protein